MRNRGISKEDLKCLRHYLPRCSNNIIAEKTGLTPIYISKVLNGVHYNMAVIEEAIVIALKEKAIRDSLVSKLELVKNQ